LVFFLLFSTTEKPNKNKIRSGDNENLVNAVSTVSVPAGGETSTSSHPSTLFQTVSMTNNDGWEDEAPITGSTYSISKKGASGTTELLDMRALQQKRREQDDVAERLRIEETRAVLQRAKLGMEREAKRLEEERAAAEAKKSSRLLSTAAPQAPATTNTSAVGVSDKWIPPNKRGLATTMATSSTFGRMSGLPEKSKGYSSIRKLDVADEEAFPDLASADKLILEAKEKAAAVHHRLTPAKKVAGSSNITPITTEVSPLTLEEKKDVASEKVPTMTDTKSIEPSESPALTKIEEDQLIPKRDEVTAAISGQTPTLDERDVQKDNEEKDSIPSFAPTTLEDITKPSSKADESGILKKKKKKKDVSSFKVGG